MQFVSRQLAEQIAAAEYPYFLSLRRNPNVDPKLPRAIWLQNRADEIMKMGASSEELKLVHEPVQPIPWEPSPEFLRLMEFLQDMKRRMFDGHVRE